MVAAAAAVSLTLTALTMWAVTQQSLALQERDWNDLRAAARAAAAERTARMSAEIEQALDALGAIWRSRGADGIDQWVDERRDFLCVLLQTESGIPQVLPQSAIEQASRLLSDEEDSPSCDPPMGPEQARQLATKLEQSARQRPAHQRAGKLLEAANCYRIGNDPSTAARCYQQAREAFEATGLPPYCAFEIETGLLACLLELGKVEAARSRLGMLLDLLLAAHPARCGPVEVELLRRRASPILATPGGAALSLPLQTLAERAQVRLALPSVVATAVRMWADETGSAVAFRSVKSEPGLRVVIAARSDSQSAATALVARADDLLARYFPPDSQGRFEPRPAAQAEDILCPLNEAFGNAVLTATAPVSAQLRAQAARRTALAVGTGLGSAAAWAVVLWLMLRAMRRQRELVRLQRRFVADVSHELKTPLAMIRLLAETLADGRVTEPHRVRAYYQTMSREAERLSGLLDRILDFSRIESGARQYRFEPCDVAAVARRAWGLFEAQFVAGGFEHRLEIQPDLPTIRADAEAIEQVLVNLLQNAFRYCGNERYVRLAVRREGYLIVITVEDHGIGMTGAQLARLGDTFFRAEGTHVRQTHGCGLGLAIVYRVVQAHGGKIEVHSRPNKGTTFTVWFPLEPPASRQSTFTR